MKLTPLIIVLLLLSGSLVAANPCQQPTTAIVAIQGDEPHSGLTGQMVWVTGVVTGAFTGIDQLGGFFIQSPVKTDSGNHSHGLFVQYIDSKEAPPVGASVVIYGEVSEQFDVTQITQVKALHQCSADNQLPAPVEIQLPMKLSDFEAYEGMRVKLSQPHVITDLYQYIKYGEMTVSSELLFSPTALYPPGDKVQAHADWIKQNQLVIDDGHLKQFAQPFAPGHDSRRAVDAHNPVFLGQSVMATGILHYGFGRYKLQPTEASVFGAELNHSLDRPAPIAGELRVATFNIENLFTTLDQGHDSCGPKQNFSCRGADNEAEYKRQMDKLVYVINQTNASVIGLQELENNPIKSIESLVNALNQQLGKEQWNFIDTGMLGEDVIKVGIIYQQETVTPKGPFALLDKHANPAFKAHQNRIVVAQTFKDRQGNLFNLATAHFKSKGCRDAEGLNQDQQDGQSCYNFARIEVAGQVAKWLDADPTGQGAAATFFVGDLNSYQHEDPIRKLKDSGFYNLADDYLGPHNWSASYRGMVGSLDYIFANSAAKAMARGLTQWHINSVVVHEFDYNTEPLGPGVARPPAFYRVDPYGSSDHDVVVAGFDF